MEIYDASGNRIYSDRGPLRYAEFWPRFGAHFLDSLIIIIPLRIIEWLILGYNWRNNWVAIIFISLIIRWLYDAIQESGPNMATLGKRALGLKVTDMHGGRITFGQATGRHFGKYISTIILYIGYFMMLGDDKRQTLHDKMAGTVVIIANGNF